MKMVVPHLVVTLRHHLQDLHRTAVLVEETVGMETVEDPMIRVVDGLVEEMTEVMEVVDGLVEAMMNGEKFSLTCHKS